MKRLLVLLAACQSKGPVHGPEVAPEPERPELIAHELDTDHGLSDLARADDGALWTLSERGRSLYRIVLDGDQLGSVDRFELTGLPDGLDTEALAIVGDGRLVIGTETHGEGRAAVWLANQRDGAIEVTGGIEIMLAVEDNRGVEGVCADDAIVVAAIETVHEEDDGARFAPVVVKRADPDELMAEDHHFVRLTSASGKLSAIHCAITETEIEVLAIERHYDTSRLIAFTLARGQPGQVDATLVRDLTALSGGRNFEGVAPLDDGWIALVVDNQSAEIKGPSELVLLPPSAP